MYLENLTWSKAEKVLNTENQIVLVLVGSTEQHGPIGPLGTDTMIPTQLAKLINERTDVLITPPMPFGSASHHMSYAGSIDIGSEALYMVLKGISQSLMKHGAKKFLFLNGHGGNTPSLDKVSLEIFEAGGLAASVDWWSLAPTLNPEWKTGHGDGQELAMVMAIDESLVDKNDLFPAKMNHINDKLQNTHIHQVKYKNGFVKIVRDIRSTINHGGIGGLDSSEATKEWGDAMTTAVVDYIVDFIDEFRQIDLKKAHQLA